jgi:aspartyl-tRNA(Asn)/glutamyl-tRNA(Gln) amidotransferase subunit A
MPVNEFIQKIKNNEIDIVEHTNKVIEECKKLNEEYNYFTAISGELALKQAENIKKLVKSNDKDINNKKLLGVAISVKDAICVKGVETNASSRILKGYKPLFNATAIEKIIENGGIIVGKTVNDEFGFGTFSVNVGRGFKIPKNPIDKERSCGGSSGGAAGLAKKAGFAHISIAESTGGSICEPASFCDVTGLCPTYGRISRYGLLDYGNSLDKIGPIGKSAYDVALLQEVMSGYDPNDSTSLDKPTDNYSDFSDNKSLKIGVIKEAFTKDVDESVQKEVWGSIKKFESLGIKYEEVSLKFPIKYSLAAYYMLGTSEASTNLAKYCGMRYGNSEELEGNFNEYFTKVRSRHFSDEAKRRIILGTFARMSGFRDAFYIKAAKVRTLIIEEYKKAFKNFDALVCPTVPILPPKFSEIKKLTPLQHYMMDIMLTGPNLAGLPHLSVPIGYKDNLPIGMLLTGDHLQEKKLLDLGNILENGS